MDQDRQFESHKFQTNDRTLSGLMAKAKSNRFYLKFDKKNSPFNANIALITNIYSNWQDPKPLVIRPARDFDAVLFIKNTTGSTKLK